MGDVGSQPTTCVHARAVWVYCGDRLRCQGSYRNCWLKHLVHMRPPTQQHALFAGVLSCRASMLKPRLYDSWHLHSLYRALSVELASFATTEQHALVPSVLSCRASMLEPRLCDPWYL